MFWQRIRTYVRTYVDRSRACTILWVSRSSRARRQQRWKVSRARSSLISRFETCDNCAHRNTSHLWWSMKLSNFLFFFFARSFKRLRINLRTKISHKEKVNKNCFTSMRLLETCAIVLRHFVFCFFFWRIAHSRNWHSKDQSRTAAGTYWPITKYKYIARCNENINKTLADNIRISRCRNLF